MRLINSVVKLYFYNRLHQIDRFRQDPEGVQLRQFESIMSHAGNTEWGRKYGITTNTTMPEYASKLPVVSYDDINGDILRIRHGENGVLWDTTAKWYAKSSGTTSDRSKFIPVTNEILYNCHYKGMKDVMALALDSYPDIKAFEGKTLTLGGSHSLDSESFTGAHSGDLSAILIQNTPFFARNRRFPKQKTALIPDFEKKVEAICREGIGVNITSFAGVPSWNLVLMNAVLQYSGKSNICEVWPNMELFMHGGVSFTPYREQYKKLIPSSRMKYIESYNASEGFFAIQDDPLSDDMLLMLDYGVFYEFLDMNDIDYPERSIALADVKKGVNYAMIITTHSGLWRYMIGDTVTFTSLKPYKIKITGRTKHFINAFGEELMVDNAERAIHFASVQSGASVSNYTAAPVFMVCGEKGAHQWLVEFEREPSDIECFRRCLDDQLRCLNSDYDAKRTNNTTLNEPIITVMPQGTFYNWMKGRGKLGGQNKIPRLANTREYADQLIEMLHGI